MVLLPGCVCCSPPSGCGCPPTCAYRLSATAPASVLGVYAGCGATPSPNTAQIASRTVGSLTPYVFDIVDAPTVISALGTSVGCEGLSQGKESPIGFYGYGVRLSLGASLFCEPAANVGSVVGIDFSLYLESIRGTIYGDNNIEGCTGGQFAGEAIRISRTARKRHILTADCQSLPERHCPSATEEVKSSPLRFWPSGFDAWVDLSGTSFGGWDSNRVSLGPVLGCYSTSIGNADLIFSALEAAVPRLSFSVQSRESCDNPLP